MWANKCIWDHGFLEFGDMYPNAPFKGQVGRLRKVLLYFLSFFVVVFLFYPKVHPGINSPRQQNNLCINLRPKWKMLRFELEKNQEEHKPVLQPASS